MKSATSSPGTSIDALQGVDLGLPEISEESVRLMEGRLPPSFTEQIAHARMLLAWANGHSTSHPPRQNERFEM